MGLKNRGIHGPLWIPKLLKRFKGSRKSIGLWSQGTFYESKLRWSEAMLSPGLIEWNDMNLYKVNIGDEETFGPLLQVFKCDHFEEAINSPMTLNTAYQQGLYPIQKSIGTNLSMRSEPESSIGTVVK